MCKDDLWKLNWIKGNVVKLLLYFQPRSLEALRVQAHVLISTNLRLWAPYRRAERCSWKCAVCLFWPLIIRYDFACLIPHASTSELRGVTAQLLLVCFRQQRRSCVSCWARSFRLFTQNQPLTSWTGRFLMEQRRLQDTFLCTAVRRRAFSMKENQ